MHVEPHIVTSAKLGLGFLTAFGSFSMTLKVIYENLKEHSNIVAFILRSLITTVLVFSFFEIFPSRPVGVSEVHLILGSTLFLLFGVAPAAVGLAAGLLLQGIFFAPTDLPQYGMNVTTLLVPLFAIAALAKTIIPAGVAYKDLSYRQVASLSVAYQGGIVAWVAFWAFYGQGFGIENVQSVMTFAMAYSGVMLVEPLIDIALLAIVKKVPAHENYLLLNHRLYQTA